MSVSAAVLRERRACLRIAREYYKNEVGWMNAYAKKGPEAMYHNAVGGKNAALEIMDAIKARNTRAKKGARK